ncbi:hypothetical protein D3C73_1020090 [compost metagenome]
MLSIVLPSVPGVCEPLLDLIILNAKRIFSLEEIESYRRVKFSLFLALECRSVKVSVML